MILIVFVCLYIRTMIDYSITDSTSFYKIDQVFQQVSAEEARLKEKATGCRNGIKPHKSGLSSQSSFSSVMGTEEQKKPFLVSMGLFHLTAAGWASGRGNFIIMVARACLAYLDNLLSWEVGYTELHSGAVITAPVWFHLRSCRFVVAQFWSLMEENGFLWLIL